MKKVLFITACMLTLLTACNKDDDNPEKDPGNFQTPLPEATQAGAGMFACYVDGKAYIAKGNNVTAFYQYYMGQYGLTIRGGGKTQGTIIYGPLVLKQVMTKL